MREQVGGKYCIASNTSSIPEVGGDLIDYHDPYDFADCYGLVRRALFDPNYRAQRERQIRQHYRSTTWEDSAAQVLATIEKEVVGSPSTMLTSCAVARLNWSQTLSGAGASKCASPTS